MRKIFILILTVLFNQVGASAADALIWECQGSEYIKDYIKSETQLSIEEKQKIIDKEISQNLDIDLVYTNLAECVQLAVENNYDIKTFSSVKKANEWNYKNAFTQLLPDFQYSFSMQDNSGVFLVGGILLRSAHEVAIQSTYNVTWPIFSQGKVIFLTAQRKNLLKASGSNLEFKKDEVILNTALTYYDLLAQKKQFEVFRTDVLDRTKQYEMVKSRFLVGLGDKFDIKRAEAELAKAKQGYIGSFNRLRFLQAKLANVMGVEVICTVYPYETTIETTELIEKSTDIETLYNMALVARYDIKAERQKIEALKAERSSNYLDFAPNVNLTYARSDAGTARLGLFPNSIIGMTVTVPLGKRLGLDTFTTVKRYNAQIEAEQYKLISLTRNIKESIIGSYYDSKTALEKVEASKKEVEASAESLKISMLKMEIGQATFLDVIQAQNLKVQAEQRLIENKIEYNKAQVQMLFDAGIISICSVLRNYNIPNSAQP